MSVLSSLLPPDLGSFIRNQQAVCAKEQKLQRSHSFQLVKLQSQIQELQQHCGEDHKRHGALRDDVHGLHTTIAYLKGRIASLTIELTCIEAKVDQKPSLPPSTAAQQANVSRQHSLQARSTPPPPPATATLMNRLHATGGSMDALADELLREQKRRLLGKLVSASPPALVL